jgi:O-antigen ligase
MFSEITSYLIHFQIIAPINNATVHDPVPFALSHTTYALYLGISIGLMLFMSLSKHLTNTLRVIYFLFFITATINIFLIASRLGFLLYFTSIITILLYYYKNNIKKIILLSILFFTVGYSVAYMNSPTFKQRVHQTIINTKKVIHNNDFSTSLGVRAGNWYFAGKIVYNNFFFGVGDGDQITEFKKLVIQENSPYKNILFHNLQNGIHSEIMDIFVKFGLIGFLIYLNIYYQLYKLKPKNEIFNVLTILLICIFILSAVQGGAIVMAVKDLGKLFTLLSVLILLSTLKEKDFFTFKK